MWKLKIHSHFRQATQAGPASPLPRTNKSLPTFSFPLPSVRWGTKEPRYSVSSACRSFPVTCVRPLVLAFPGSYVDLIKSQLGIQGFLNSGILLNRLRIPGTTENYVMLKSFKFSISARIKDLISFKIFSNDQCL